MKVLKLIAAFEHIIKAASTKTFSFRKNERHLKKPIVLWFSSGDSFHPNSIKIVVFSELQSCHVLDIED